MKLTYLKQHDVALPLSGGMCPSLERVNFQYWITRNDILEGTVQLLAGIVKIHEGAVKVHVQALGVMRSIGREIRIAGKGLYWAEKMSKLDTVKELIL